MNDRWQFQSHLVDGKKLACHELVLGCRRFLDDIESGIYDFDYKTPEKVIRIIETTFVHVKGVKKNQPFLLEDWQKFIVYNLLGFRLKGSDKRRYQEAFIFVPRKNGKTQFASALAWALTGKKMTEVGGSLTKYVTAPLMAAGAGLVAIGAQFDDAYDNIRIGTGATGDALKGLTDDFKAVASTVPASFDTVSKAVADYNTRLDLSGEALQELAAQTINLSNITGADLGGTIEDTSKTFKAFNLSSKDYGKSLDFVFKVSQSTGIELSRLQGNLQKFAPALKSLGLEFKESATLMGMMDKAGVDVESSMTALNKAVVSMAREGVTDASEAIQILMANIKKAPTSVEAVSIAMETFGTKGGVAMATAIREGKIEFQDLLAVLDGSGESINGVASETYDWAESFTVLLDSQKFL